MESFAYKDFTFVCAPETYIFFSANSTVNAQMQLVKMKLSKSNYI